MKILLIRFSSAGDIILAAEAVKAIKASYRDAKICFLSKEEYSDLQGLMPIDRIFLTKFRGRFFKDLAIILEKAKLLSAENFDYVFDLQNNVKSRLLAALIKTKKRTIYKKDIIKRRLTVLFKWFLDERQTVSAKYLSAIKHTLNLKPQTAKILRTRREKSILMHIGAKWKLKRWPYFFELVNELKKQGRFKITITGLKDEVENSDKILYIKGQNIKNLVGKTDFLELINLIKKTGLFIGNDTAAAHLARHFNVPAIVFLGPTVQSFGFITENGYDVFEKDLSCRPCHLHGGNTCPTGEFVCMKSINARDVAVRARRILKK